MCGIAAYVVTIRIIVSMLWVCYYDTWCYDTGSNTFDTSGPFDTNDLFCFDIKYIEIVLSYA